MILFAPIDVLAGSVRLGWDANTEENLAGYKLHWGIESGNYTNTKDVGNVTQYTITGLADGVRYYFSATAYTDYPKESEYSNEVSHVVGEPVNQLPEKAICCVVETDCDESEDVIIDNKDDQVISSGRWQESSGPNPYKGSSLWSMTEGSEFIFPSNITGKTAVYLWWTVQTTYNIERCKNAKVEIHNSSGLIDTVQVDQTLNGGQWNHIGEYVFDGLAQVAFKVGSERCSVSVDAVKFETIN